ncbi:hypothetical protein HNY73_011854 [Argiope bruennichi]|uniref:Uncharacterized protein n=1 Tax=Argiope bruennichi TaxID=94029 RepID=A0A8T0ETB2_ARGBR|nr:hypothetical protein HNY73_011854 [Argiope bruennichi]
MLLQAFPSAIPLKSPNALKTSTTSQHQQDIINSGTYAEALKRESKTKRTILLYPASNETTAGSKKTPNADSVGKLLSTKP